MAKSAKKKVVKKSAKKTTEKAVKKAVKAKKKPAAKAAAKKPAKKAAKMNTVNKAISDSISKSAPKPTHQPTEIKKLPHTEIIAALRAAKQAAIAADPGKENDGGSCNLDSVEIHFKGMSEASIQEIAKQADVRLSGGGRSQRHFLGNISHGQGDRRTIMVEAAYKTLQNTSLSDHVSIWYQMD